MCRFVLSGAAAVVFSLLVAAPSYASPVNQSRGITINGNSGFLTCGCATGAGTASNPYVVGPFAITSENAGNSAVTIENTTADFVLTGISANYTDTDPTHPVLNLTNVAGPASVSNLSANGDGMGVELYKDSNITLDSTNVNKMVGTGVYIDSSTNIALSNGKYKATADGEPPHEEDGLYAVNSSHISIGGLATCPTSTPCNTFDYDSGWGVFLQNTNNVTINNASANADDTGSYILDGTNTYNVNLTNSTAEGGGPICISLNGSKTPTGYFNTDLVGGVMLVNGAHNNTVSGDNITGMSSLSGFNIAGGGNSFYYNVCTGLDTTFNPPPDGLMGSGNTFSNNCYSTSNDVADLPPSTCPS
jgi:hypothetical protein